MVTLSRHDHIESDVQDGEDILSPAAQLRLQTRLAKLDTELDIVNKQREALAKERRKVAWLHAKMLCRQFAAEFCARLPRETRDMVYAEVWLEPFVPTHESYDSPHLDADWDFRRRREKFCYSPWLYHPCEETPCNCYLLSELPVWVFHQFVGIQVATEASEAHYRTVEIVADADHLPDIDAFLTRDHWHLNVKPANHMRYVQLFIRATDDNELGYGAIEDFPKLKRYLKPLLGIRLKEGFHLSLGLEDGGSMPIAILKALEFVVVPLRAAGAIVKVTCGFHNGFGSKDDISDFYDMPADVWIAKRRLVLDARRVADSDSSVTDSDSSEDVSHLDDLETDDEEDISEHDETISSDESEADALKSLEDVDDARNRAPASDPVIRHLAEHGRTNPELLGLMKVVAAGEASKEELVAFQRYLNAASAQNEV